jgi:hypothetical protein
VLILPFVILFMRGYYYYYYYYSSNYYYYHFTLRSRFCNFQNRVFWHRWVILQIVGTMPLNFLKILVHLFLIIFAPLYTQTCIFLISNIGCDSKFLWEKIIKSTPSYRICHDRNMIKICFAALKTKTKIF